MKINPLVLLLFMVPPLLYAQDETPDTTLLTKHVRYNDLRTTSVTNNLDQEAIHVLGGSATDLLSRIAGVSFMSGKLVSFRGLNPRYSNITIDGLAAPITQQNIKAYSLSLLPTSAVQGVYVDKSGSFISQGEWGGAVVNINTNATVYTNFNAVSFGVGYQHNFTFKDYVTDCDYSKIFADFLGYGVNRLDFTNDIVDSETLQSMTRDESATEGAKMRNTWGLEKRTALPSFSIGFSMGRVLKQDGISRFSTINSISYSRNQNGAHYNRAKYTGYEFNEKNEAVSSDLKSYSTDGIYSTKTGISVNSGWNYQVDSRNAFNLNLSYTHDGNFSTISKYLVSLESQKDGYFARYSLLTKDVFLARLSGKDDLTDDFHLNWALGYGLSGRNEPDQRNMAAQRAINSDEPYLIVIPSSSKADFGARFNSKMTDNSYSGRFDLRYDLMDDQMNVAAGFLIEINDRQFDARLLTTVKDDFTDADLLFVAAKDFANVFSSENYGSNGYYLNDATTDYDSYSAGSKLFSGYMGINNVFINRWRTSLGFRVENYQTTLESGDIDIDNNTTDILPYFDASFRPADKVVLKIGYSHSVNRPAFRELSPYTFYDFDYRTDIKGNPDLENATIRNLDLSFLYIFGSQEYLSVSPFYKKIENPIEMIYIVRSDKPLFTFDNAHEAELGGIEVEFSKRFSNYKESYLHNLIFLGSFSYTSSSINLGDSTSEVSSSRPLQGQIPLIFSGGLTFITPQKDAQVTVEYKHMGKSLFSVGDGVNTFPWYNAPSNMLNAGVGYTLKNNLTFHITAVNLLNARISQFEDTNYNGSITDDVDKEVSRGLTYQYYNFSVSYKF